MPNGNFDRYSGADLAAAHKSGDFIPLPVSGSVIQIDNLLGLRILGAVIFQLDL